MTISPKRKVILELPIDTVRLTRSGQHVLPAIPHDAPAIAAVQKFSAQIIRELACHPDRIRTLPPREFEHLVAELLSDMGYDIQLTPQSRDGGRDVLAILNTPLGRLLTLVECKRFAADRPVGVDIVERFLWIVERRDKANAGLIVTTSYFSEPALALQNEYSYRLGLKDGTVLQQWLSQFGSWHVGGDASLWLPSRRVSSPDPAA